MKGSSRMPGLGLLRAALPNRVVFNFAHFDGRNLSRHY